MNIIAVVVVILAIVFVYWLLKNETFDLMCPEGCKKFGSDCFEGNSKYFAQGKYSPTDTNEQILRKIGYLNTYSDRIVTWRRFFVTSVIATFCVCGIAQVRDVRIGLLIFMCIFGCINGMVSFYKYHVEVYPQGYLKENVAALRKRFKYSESVVSDDLKTTIGYITGKMP